VRAQLVGLSIAVPFARLSKNTVMSEASSSIAPDECHKSVIVLGSKWV
jgi:hypothetical protein